MAESNAGAEGGQSTPEGSVQSDAGTGSEGTTETPASGQGSTAAKGTEAADAVSRAEFDALRNQLSAADKNRSKAEAELQAIKDKDLPEAARLKRDFEKATAENERLQADLQKARIENAFLSDNTHKWRDPKLAQKNIDLSRVTIDADGNVTGLSDALKTLAKAYPFMLEPASPEGGTEGEKKPAQFTPAAGATGAGNDSKKLDVNRFPALRRRTSR